MRTLATALAPLMQLVAGGRWWAFLTTVVTVAVTLLNDGTATDLVVAYWLEGLAWIAVAYVKDLHSSGPVTCVVVSLARQDQRAVIGQPLPDDLRKTVASRSLTTNLVIAWLAGTFATSLSYELVGGLTADPLLWVGVVATMLSGAAMELWGWWNSDQPSTTSIEGGGAAPINRMLLVTAVALVSGVTAVKTTDMTGTLVGLVAFVITRGWAEPAIMAGVDRRRAAGTCCPPHSPARTAPYAGSPHLRDGAPPWPPQ